MLRRFCAKRQTYLLSNGGCVPASQIHFLYEKEQGLIFLIMDASSHNEGKKRSKQFYFISSKTLFILLNVKEQGLESEQIIGSMEQIKAPVSYCLKGNVCMGSPHGPHITSQDLGADAEPGVYILKKF